MAYGPGRGIVLLDSLADDPLIRQRERAVRAHLLELNGRPAGRRTVPRGSRPDF